ncbi:beta-lactamase-like protein 2 homolog isoform X2 [Halyomorpha halys]|uniref:beta-lactamase-like protein 2 homolog isoform X2 n=1 Tax=Halyomorpha halys TaxID=286706 RepID=UPI000D0C8F1E|nr:beta-lactamase-like protein 2 homolog isoform X2 [Halyomorpha halys]
MSTVLPIVSKLTPRVIRILGCNPGKMTLQGTNTYIIGTGKKILLDTGEKGKKDYINELKKILHQESASIEQVIVTHWHGDHIGGLRDVNSIIGDELSAWKYPRNDVKNESYDGITIHSLQNQQELSVEGASLRIIYTPGHTTDHVVVYMKEENALFSGDCILGEGTAVFEDLYDYMKSLNIILNLKPDVIYPGHGPVLETPVEKILYYINHRNQRESQIKEVLAKKEQPLSELDIVKIIYKDTPESLYLAASNNVNQHLLKMEKEGIVHKNERGWILV